MDRAFRITSAAENTMRKLELFNGIFCEEHDPAKRTGLRRSETQRLRLQPEQGRGPA
jgi:hypothetical protein